MYAVTSEKIEKLSIEKVSICLTKNWWSSSYSYHFYSEKKKETQIIPIGTHNTQVTSIIEKDEMISRLEVDILRGDYHIKEINYATKDYAYHQKLKKRFVKYSMYPAVLLALIFTFSILSILVEI